MKYQKRFETLADYNSFVASEDFIEPNISIVLSDESIHYHAIKQKEIPYLKFTAKQANSSVRLNRVGSATALPNASVQYSTDNGESWNTYTISTASAQIPLTNVGDSVLFKGNNQVLASGASNYHKFVMGGQLEGSGDLTSLFNETGGDITMAASACSNLFSGCTSLLIAPELPSTELSNACYYSLFRGCSNLKEIKYHAPNIYSNACGGWVYGCSSFEKFYLKNSLIPKFNNTSLMCSVSAVPIYTKCICDVDTNEPMLYRVLSFDYGGTTHQFNSMVSIYGMANGEAYGAAYGILGTSSQYTLNNFSNCVFLNLYPLFLPTTSTTATVTLYEEKSVNCMFLSNVTDEFNKIKKTYEAQSTYYSMFTSTLQYKTITNINFVEI